NGAPSVASDMSIDFSCVVKFQEKVCTGSGRENRCGFLGAYEQTGVAVNTVKNIAHDLIDELERTVRYETPVIMGIDEVNPPVSA
uniref:hypothetical protein n=1 Tax=Thiolapillus sp. TaxID=2017437 RepID=UPI003AF7D193